MKQNRVTSKIIGIALVFVMLGTMLGGLASVVNSFDNQAGVVRASTLADGKGMWIWKIWELGDGISEIINKLESAGVKWVTIKCGDSNSYYPDHGYMYNWLQTNGYSDIGEVVAQFHNAGITVFGWHYVYSKPVYSGTGYSTEADVSNKILDIPGIDGLIIDAETEYEGEGKGPIAEAYMIDIRNKHPSNFIAYSTFPIIDYHLWFPYIEFGRYCDAVMPQTYWKDISVTPTEMVNWMDEQWDKWHETWKSGGYGDSVKPLIPIGQGDVPGSEITEFCDVVLSQYEDVSLWRYGIMTSEAWSAYAAAGQANYYAKFLRMAQWLTSQQRANGGIQEAEDYSKTITDNTVESIWTWSCYAELTQDYTTYLQNINNAWDFCYANPSWEEGSSPTDYYTVYNLGWGLLAETKYREAYQGRPEYVDRTWYSEQCASTLVNYTPSTDNTRSALCLGFAAGALYQYALSVGNSVYRLRAIELGNNIRQWLEADVTRFASEDWAVSSGIAVWGVLNSYFQENLGGHSWVENFASHMPPDSHDGKNNSYEYGHDGWYAWGYYASSRVLEGGDYFDHYQNILDYVLSADGDEDGGIPRGPTYSDNQDFAWVTNVAAFALNLGLLGPSAPDYFSEDWIEKVITWASEQAGRNYWEGYCMAFISDAFKVCENRPASANDLKTNLEDAGEFYSEENGWDLPRGALVFFSATGDYAPYGHVGVSLGDGKVSHAYETVREDAIEDIEDLSFIGSYLGWAYPPEEWFSPQFSNTFKEDDFVSKEEGWNLRDIPSLYGKVLSTAEGTGIIIEDEYNGICNAGYYWWHVNLGDYEGWSIEGGLALAEWNPWVYDENKDGEIQKIEAVRAVMDYFDGTITKDQALEVIALYFAS